MEEIRQPRISEIVIYFNEDRQPHAAIVAHVHNGIRPIAGRPICNLAIIKRDGRIANRIMVEPAYHDGTRWRTLNKWAYDGEVPEEEYKHLPLPTFQGRDVGNGETLTVSKRLV